jgi:hypothetical protein
MTDEEFEEYKIFMVQYNKDKMSWYENGFIKSDVDLPF